MNRFFLLALMLYVFGYQPQAAFGTDTLRRDSLMLTTSIEVMFKAGTAYRTNSRGLVVEGTPLYDVDLWTTGPMLRFAAGAPVKWNADGRVYMGTIATNCIVNCVDNVFREFVKDCRVMLDDHGLLLRGTPVGSISFVVQGQEFMSQPYKPIGFYPNGKLHLVHPQTNLRLTASNGNRLIISSQSWIELSEQGAFLRGSLLRKLAYTRRDGTDAVLHSGEVVRMDEDGNIIND